MRKLIALGVVLLLAMMSPPTAVSQDRPIDVTAQSANVFRAPGGQGLTPPSPAAPTAIVADFLRLRGYEEETVGSLVVTSENRVARTGWTHLRFQQELGGLQVYGTYVKATVNDSGELVHLIESLATPTGQGLVPALIGAGEALEAALDENHSGVDVDTVEESRSANTVTFSGNGFFYRGPTVTRVAIAMESGVIQEGFLVETWTAEDNLLHHTLVGGNGQVLAVELRTNNESYNIFPAHPGQTTGGDTNPGQAWVSGPGLGNSWSSEGWVWLYGNHPGLTHYDVNITGNNVHAYLDLDGNNSPDSYSVDNPIEDCDEVGGGVVCDFIENADLTRQPYELDGNSEDNGLFDNGAAAIQNLFYWNNWIHDKLYQHGFTESEGNFQENNVSGGDTCGDGGDSVNAEAQDYWTTNNANFATPLDGCNPRMQMGLWSTFNGPGDLKRDGDLDSDIIFHEYGHGLTWRMIGGMSGAMSGAVGEGMSDVLAILINNNDRVGEYSYNDPAGVGIRSAPYTGYSRTYGDFTGDSVHKDGEIYAATIWRLWEIFQGNGLDDTINISQDILFDYLIRGMIYTAPGPAFEDMRDGILDAVGLAGTGDECLIWEAFAAFGVGVGANAEITKKGNPARPRITVTITESMALPTGFPDDCSNVDPPVDPPPDGFGSIKGTVTYVSGAKLGGEMVVADATGGTFSGQTNRGGKYGIGDVPPGTYTVMACGETYGSVTVSAGQTTTSIDFVCSQSTSSAVNSRGR